MRFRIILLTSKDDGNFLTLFNVFHCGKKLGLN